MIVAGAQSVALEILDDLLVVEIREQLADRAGT